MAGGIISLIEEELFDNKGSGRLSAKRLLYLLLLILGCAFYISQQFISHEAASGYFMAIAVVLLAGSVYLYRKSIFSDVAQKLLKPIAWLATISYPFYLLHQNIGYIIISTLEENGITSELGGVFIPFVAVLMLAFIMHKTIEKPISRL